MQRHYAFCRLFVVLSFKWCKTDAALPKHVAKCILTPWFAANGGTGIVGRMMSVWCTIRVFSVLALQTLRTFRIDVPSWIAVGFSRADCAMASGMKV